MKAISRRGNSYKGETKATGFLRDLQTGSSPGLVEYRATPAHAETERNLLRPMLYDQEGGQLN